MRGRAASRALATAVAAVLGAVWLSGSGQPVIAHPYPRWQEIAPPPFAARTHALATHVGPRVLILGGRGGGSTALRDGASYDLRTGRWHHLRLPVSLSDGDHAATAAGVLVVQHQRQWWRYDPRADVWTRMRGLPPALSAPAAFRSEVYALSRRHVVVYSTRLHRWSRLPADRLRPVLHATSVSASRRGTVVTGYAGGHRVTDRWDGLRWHRGSAPPAPARADRDGTRLEVGGRTFALRSDRAWIRLP